MTIRKKQIRILNSFFASVFENEGAGDLPDFQDRQFAEPLCSTNINTDRISKAVDKTNASKSNMHPKLIKECKNSMLLPLKTIFTKSLEEGKIPHIWKVGHISAIHKNGRRTKAENYRQISLTSVPGKILEKLIRDEIVDHMTKKNLFSSEQHGFISGKSCTTQ